MQSFAGWPAYIICKLAEAGSPDAKVLLGLGLVPGPLVHGDQPIPKGLIVFVVLEGGHVEAAQQLIVALCHLCLGVLHHLDAVATTKLKVTTTATETTMVNQLNAVTTNANDNNISYIRIDSSKRSRKLGGCMAAVVRPPLSIPTRLCVPYTYTSCSNLMHQSC